MVTQYHWKHISSMCVLVLVNCTLYICGKYCGMMNYENLESKALCKVHPFLLKLSPFLPQARHGAPASNLIRKGSLENECVIQANTFDTIMSSFSKWENVRLSYILHIIAQQYMLLTDEIGYFPSIDGL